jgi:hypothetical protein
VLTISGQQFGDDCLDTGTLPPGIGPLGTPLEGLAIVIVQGSNEFVLASGSADSDYEFRVEVVVPAELEPGEATLNILGAGDARLTVTPTLRITSAEPSGPTETTIATFGPPTTLEPEPPGTDPVVVLPAEIPDGPPATTPTLSTTPVAVNDDNNHTDQQRAISVGFAGVVAIAAIVFAVWNRSNRRGNMR